ncbi:FAD-dependent oxidoreductase [Bacillus licheniformis]|nr:FAD-dependent oxidoreductase [Bacillus licheniformis]
MAAGVRPNIELAKASGISTNRAIIVSDYMETNVPNVYAVGECAEHNGTVYGLVKPLYEQGKVLAKHICGLECSGYQGSVQSAALKCPESTSFGREITEDDSTTAIKLLDEAAGVYKKRSFKGIKWPASFIRRHQRQSKAVGKHHQTKGYYRCQKELFQSEEDSSVASMAVRETICQCTRFQRHDHGSDTDARFKDGRGGQTLYKASGSCGGCRPLVEELLLHTAEHDGHISAAEQPMCACTSFTEDEVVNEIQMRNLSSVHEVISALGWKIAADAGFACPRFTTI